MASDGQRRSQFKLKLRGMILTIGLVTTSSVEKVSRTQLKPQLAMLAEMLSTGCMLRPLTTNVRMWAPYLQRGGGSGGCRVVGKSRRVVGQRKIV